MQREKMSAESDPPDRQAPRPFLTAEWRHLAMLNYEIDPAVLLPRVPVGTELDLWQGRALVSVVGFLFLSTRVRGWSIPWHRDFEEVNLRFYVRRAMRDGVRRGVVFVRELVPRAAIAWVARTIYQEPYLAVPMWHRIGTSGDEVRRVEYGWRFHDRENRLRLGLVRGFRHLQAGEQAEFITEHYWGYTGRDDGTTREYGVEHPPWRVAEAAETGFDCDVAGLYGEEFATFLTGEPMSAFLAEGSPVVVREGRRIA